MDRLFRKEKSQLHKISYPAVSQAAGGCRRGSPFPHGGSGCKPPPPPGKMKLQVQNPAFCPISGRKMGA